jgi:hypothetical protein
MKKAFLTLYLFLVLFNLMAQTGYPHILVKDSDKPAILDKVKHQPWARKILMEMDNDVKPYVERHLSDPQWILSRYQMNRVEGKRYTHAYSDESGTKLTGLSGDAPVPTVRVSTHKRPPITEKGSRYIQPKMEDLVPNDTARLMWLKNPETGQKDLVDPQTMIASINGDINDLALSAAIIYWLKGDERYARFTADILDQWGRGASYQEPIIGPCRTGFLDMQSLSDGTYRSLILAYDFVKPYLERQGYPLDFYQTVFEKFAHTMIFRGFWNNNWYAAQSSTLVYAALSLEDPAKRDYYLQYFLERDTIAGACGQLGMPTTVREWLTPDGHWKEPGGYHNFPVSNLILGALALEKNGYDVFQRFPELFRASYAMLKYAFPNLRVSAFGDTGRASQSPQSLEIGLILAAQYGRPEIAGMMSAMDQLIGGGMYKREQSGYLGLLCYLPEFPETESIPYSWPRSGELDFARFYLQRNGMDPYYGLMYGVQGASYNHNHCNGMAMELYGCGEIMGIDAGTGPTYEHPMHVNYFSQWAAHNTVVAAGSSSSVPVNGSAGRKNIGQLELAAMEPMPGEEAVSPLYSFTDTRYLDNSTQTNQLRTMAIIRTSDTTGYYVDIYRSDNSTSNDYVYHNIGDKLDLIGLQGEEIETVKTGYPLTGKDHPGFRFFSEVEKAENYGGMVKALFPAKNSDGKDIFMQVTMPSEERRTYFKAYSPAVKTAGEYNNQPLPVLSVRTEKEAWTNPFVSVFEPFSGAGGNSVVSVEKDDRHSGRENTLLKVKHRDASEQWIFQGNGINSEITDKDLQFSGHFGVADLKNGKLQRLYLGEGKSIAFQGISMEATVDPASAELRVVDERSFSLSCNQPVKIGIKAAGVKRVVLTVDGVEKVMQPLKREKGRISWVVPAGKDIRINL